ncbi:MAG: porin family protein [Rhodobacteraceae bacterium]|nr:porin family protein [Paracoccaceae bacterium]
MMRFSVTLAAAAFVGSAAFAAGPRPVAVEPGVYHAPAPVSGFNWEGFYAGASLGYGSTNYDPSINWSDPSIPAALGIDLPDLGGRGGLGSLQAGYNFMLSDNMVAGIQLDGTFSAINNTTGLNLMLGPNEIDFEYRIAPRTMYTIAGRLGYLTNPDTMVYGLLGYTRANFRGSWDLLATDGVDTFTADGSYSFALNGAAIGMGIETRLSNNMTLGLEYRYNHMQRYSFIDQDGVFTPDDNLEIGFDTSVQTIRAGLNFHF